MLSSLQWVNEAVKVKQTRPATAYENSITYYNLQETVKYVCERIHDITAVCTTFLGKSTVSESQKCLAGRQQIELHSEIAVAVSATQHHSLLSFSSSNLAVDRTTTFSWKKHIYSSSSSSVNDTQAPSCIASVAATTVRLGYYHGSSYNTIAAPCLLRSGCTRTLKPCL